MIVKGRVQKTLAETCLEEQQFIKDQSVRIKDLLKQNDLKLIDFVHIHQIH